MLQDHGVFFVRNVVLPDGDLIDLTGLNQDLTGYPLDLQFGDRIGSEGVLSSQFTLCEARFERNGDRSLHGGGGTDKRI